jgi:exodeoxyribonuclease-3
MNLFSWNVNGLRSVLSKGKFLPFITQHQPDILCLQETKAAREQVEIDLPGYHEYWNSAVKPGYSGTAIFSRTEPIAVTLGFPKAIAKKHSMTEVVGRDAANEGRVITAEFPTFYVVNVYVPNTKPDLSRLAFRHQQWDPAFLAHCKALDKKKPVIFCGDLNVAHTELDLANPKSNIGRKGFTQEERAGFQAFLDAGFVDTFRKFHEGNGFYTWWAPFANARARNIGWRIDYVLVSKRLAKSVVAADIHPKVMGSDHCPVSVELAS